MPGLRRGRHPVRAVRRRIHPHRSGDGKDANPDVNATLTQTIDIVNGMAEQPALIIHTGDITHLSKPAEFDLAEQLFSRMRTTEMHTVPGEHDTTDPTVTEYFSRFGKPSANKGDYSV